MMRSRVITKLILAIGILCCTTSCATFYQLEGISDYSELELVRGDSVNITTTDEEMISMIIYDSDADYFYGEEEGEKVRKSEIKSLALSRFYSEKLVFSYIGLLLLSFFFSG